MLAYTEYHAHAHITAKYGPHITISRKKPTSCKERYIFPGKPGIVNAYKKAEELMQHNRL